MAFTRILWVLKYPDISKSVSASIYVAHLCKHCWHNPLPIFANGSLNPIALFEICFKKESSLESDRDNVGKMKKLYFTKGKKQSLSPGNRASIRNKLRLYLKLIGWTRKARQNISGLGRYWAYILVCSIEYSSGDIFRVCFQTWLPSWQRSLGGRHVYRGGLQKL